MKTQFQDKIPLFDLHCDTVSELYKRNLSLYDSNLHISLKKALPFSPYIQVASVWTDKNDTDDEGYHHFLKCVECFENQKHALGTAKFILGVEDARILNNDISKLQVLFDRGVRVLTLSWKGNTCIGGGWDTDKPLTHFGKQVVLKCAELGIAVDLSHSSTAVQNQVFSLSRCHGFIPIFSHSNSYSVCHHKRNISDNAFKQIASLGGLVGISFCCEHLTINGDANIFTILKHIEHFLALGGADTICLGCDLDGVEHLPDGICSISDLSKLYTVCTKEFGQNITEKLFFNNAQRYFSKLL